MSINPNHEEKPRDESEVTHERWGNGMVVIADDSDTGEWVMYDPDEDTVDLEEWR